LNVAITRDQSVLCTCTHQAVLESCTIRGIPWMLKISVAKSFLL
jgi:hypothetical protein